MSATSRKRAAEEPLKPFQAFEDPFELTNAVISALNSPEHPTIVAQQYANDKNLAAEVQAYAKIAGRNWTYFVRSLDTSIGRNTDVTRPDEKPIDIDLGPAKVVSRKHAAISYNLVSRVWELKVLGRNGAKIDTVRIPCGPDVPPAVLKSGTVMDIGGTQMMFILPDTAPQIADSVLNAVAPKIPGLLDYMRKRPNYNGNYYNNLGAAQHQSLLTFSNTYQQQQHQQQQQQSGNIKSFAVYNSALNQTDPYYGGAANGSHISGGNLMSTMKSSSQGYVNIDADLSKDESRDLKPPYSYATMITQAILSNEEGVLSLSEIYDWIARNYAFYRYSKTGWQNSIRHNLSLNKAFEKVPRKPNEPGKGMKWQIADSYKEEFLKSLATGSISKIRRGSSVSRQLQLHLAMHRNLPISFKDKLDKNKNEKKSSPPSQQHPINQLTQATKSQANYINGNNTQALSYMAAAATTQPQYQPVSPQKSDEASSGSKNTVLGDKPVDASNNQRNGVHTPSPTIPEASTNSNKENKSENNPTVTGPVNIDLMSFASPNKGYTVSALEAYTPERGSRNLASNDKQKHVKNGSSDSVNFNEDNEQSHEDNENGKIDDNKNKNNEHQNNLQASPAIWNFVQFGTPSSQTPKPNKNTHTIAHGNVKDHNSNNNEEDDDEAAKNLINGSPIQQRKKAMLGNTGAKGQYGKTTQDNEFSDLKGVDLVKGFKK